MWYVETMVEERINNALREGERARLVRMVKGAKTPRTLRGLLDSVKANVRSGQLVSGWRQLQEPT